MTKAIVVTFKGPTATKPARWKVQAEGLPPIWINRERGGIDVTEREAAQTLADHYSWGTVGQSGGLPDGSTVFCLPSKAEEAQQKALRALLVDIEAMQIGHRFGPFSDTVELPEGPAVLWPNLAICLEQYQKATEEVIADQLKG